MMLRFALTVPSLLVFHVSCFSVAAAEDYPLTLDEITVRDPFIHADPGTKTYYLYAQTGNRGGPKALFAAHGGHAMLFRTFDGTLRLTLHQPNSGGPARAKLFTVEETADSLEVTPWEPNRERGI